MAALADGAGFDPRIFPAETLAKSLFLVVASASFARQSDANQGGGFLEFSVDGAFVVDVAQRMCALVRAKPLDIGISCISDT